MTFSEFAAWWRALGVATMTLWTTRFNARMLSSGNVIPPWINLFVGQLRLSVG